MWDADPSPDWVDWAPETTGESVLAHFEAKLRELAADMNTETGQQLAADRHEFLVAFERRFRREWLGDA
jgi:HD superfamily phosphodiesterase